MGRLDQRQSLCLQYSSDLTIDFFFFFLAWGGGCRDAETGIISRFVHAETG